MIALPSSEELGKVLKGTPTERGFAREELPEEICKLGGQRFEPQGLALALLSACKQALQRYYGRDKSMFSLEGMALVSNTLPKYVRLLVPDEQVCQQVIRDTTAQLSAVTLI